MSKKKDNQDNKETTYSRAEIMAAAISLGIKPEVLAGALRMVKKDRLTKAEIREAIEEFKKRKVK